MGNLPPDDLIINRLQKSDEKIFKQLFDYYYANLVRYALRLLNKPEIAEEIVQDVFERLWVRREEIEILKSISSYLFTSVRYRCINHFKDKIQKLVLQDDLEKLDQTCENTPHDELVYKDLKEALKVSIESLPEQCRIIFNLSRNSGLSNHEIADQLNLAPKTVENQITIALKKIKEFLQKNWYVIFAFLLGVAGNLFDLIIVP